MTYVHTHMPPEEIAQIRTDLGWTFERMAAELGVTDRAIYNYISGANAVPVAIARCLRMLSKKPAEAATAL